MSYGLRWATTLMVMSSLAACKPLEDTLGLFGAETKPTTPTGTAYLSYTPTPVSYTPPSEEPAPQVVTPPAPEPEPPCVPGTGEYLLRGVVYDLCTNAVLREL